MAMADLDETRPSGGPVADDVLPASRSRRRPTAITVPSPDWPWSRWFLAVAIPFGLFFVFAVPPTQGIDESAHFLRAWLVSQGDLVARTQVDPASGTVHAGGQIDQCVMDYVYGFQARAAQPDDFEVADFWFDTPDCEPRDRGWEIADAASNYAPVAYLPQVVAIGSTRAVGLPLPISFFAGRLAGLAAYLALVWWALRLAPGGRAVMFVVGLLPTSIMSAATYNADGLAIGLGVLAVALTGSLALAERVDRWRLAALAATLVAVGLIKQPYLVLAGLPLAIPDAAFGSRARAWVTKGAVGAVVVAASLGWFVLGSPEVSPAVFRADVDHGRQLSYVLHHPLDFVATVARTVAAAGPQSYTLRGLVGSFGMGRYVGRSNDVVAPLIAVVAVAVLLTAAAGRDLGAPRALATRRRLTAVVVPLAVAVAGFFAVYGSMYLIWAPVGAPYVSDVQGRYFVPLLCVPTLALVLRRHEAQPDRSSPWIVAGVVAVLAFAVGKSFLVFY